MMSIFLSGCMLTGTEYPYARSDHTANEMQIERSSRCQQLQANCICHSSLQGTWAGLAVTTRQVPVDCRQPIWYQASKKNAFDRVNHWTLANKLLDRNVPLHIVKLFIFWY